MNNMVETTSERGMVGRAILAIFTFVLAITLLPSGSAYAATTPTIAEGETWYTSTTDKSTYTSINIVDSYSPTGSELESWDASAAQDGSVMAYVSADGTSLTLAGNGSGSLKTHEKASCYFKDFSSMTSINGLSLLDTSGTINLSGFFMNDESLVSVEGIENWDVSSCVDFASMFSNCLGLASIDLSQWDMSSANIISSLFCHCESLTDVKPPANTITNLQYAYRVFYWCTSLTQVDVSFLNGGHIDNVSSMFSNCTSLTSVTGYETIVTAETIEATYIFEACHKLECLDVSQWDVSGLTAFDGMFAYMYSLKAIDGLECWDVSNAESLYRMFLHSPISNLDGVCGWDVSNVVNFKEMFGITDIVSLDLSSWDTASAENMHAMFEYCQELLELKLGPNFTTDHVTDFNSMFRTCSKMEVLDISMLDTRAASDMTDFFTGMRVLQQVSLGENFSFTGDGSSSCVLPTPDPTYIAGATGNWQAVGTGTVDEPTGTVYAPADVPSNVAETYVMESVKVPVLGASSSWYKGATDKAAIVTINIVDSYTADGTETESWDASAEQDGSVMAYVGADGTTLTIAGNGSGYIMANKDSSFAFDSFSSVTAINGTELLDTSNTTRMDCMFSDCEVLETLNLDNWDVSNVYMFNLFAQNCYALTSFGSNNLGDWDTSAAEQFSNSFDNCESLKALDVSNWDMSSCEVFNYMFSDCKSLEVLDVSEWNLLGAIKMAYTFQNCKSLSTLDFTNWDTSQVVDMSGFLSGCAFSTIDVSGLDLATCEDVDYFFYNCKNLKSIEGVNDWDTNKVELMNWAFYGCENLESLNLSNWTTPALTSASAMFYNCKSLKVLDLGNFDTSNVTAMSNVFYGMNNLRQITLGEKFSFTGDGTATNCVLPTPDPAYIPGATGKWQAVADGTVDEPAGTVYLPADVPSNVAETYVIEAQGDPILAANATWYKGTTDKATIVTINIVDSYTPDGTETESWDASEAQDGSVVAYVGADGTTLTIAGNGSGCIYTNKYSRTAFQDFESVTAINGADLLDTSNTTDMGYMFRGCENMVTLDVSNFDTSSCTDMSDMFYWCKSVTELDVSNFDTSNVTAMDDVFGACNALTELDVSQWNTSNCEYMNGMFYGCKGLTELDVSSFDTSACTDMSFMFAYASGVKTLDLDEFDTSNVSDMSYMFSGCSNLTTIDVSGFDTSKNEDFSGMFQWCNVLTDLQLNGFVFAGSTDISCERMFLGCKALTALDLSNWNTSNVSNLSSTFMYCRGIDQLDLSNFDTSNVTKFDYCFSDCTGLMVLDISSWDTSAVTSSSDMQCMFDNCCVLQQVTLGADYSFNGGTDTRNCNLPTPDPTYFPGTTGKWQAVASGTVEAPEGTAYLPEDVPNNVAETYVIHYQGDPILAVGSTWYKGTTLQNTIVTINVVDSYTADGTEVESWDASEAQDGSVMAYVLSDGTTLVIAGNGRGMVYANPDSTRAFGNADNNTTNGNEFTALITFSGGDVLDMSKVTTATRMFNGDVLLETLDVSTWDMSNAKLLDSMFSECNALKVINAGNWDVSSAEDMSSLFSGCRSVTSLDLADWDTSSCTDMGYLFYMCLALNDIDLTGWDTSKVTTMTAMFGSCYNLPQLDVSSFNTAKVENFSFMFQSLLGLTALDVSGFDTSSATTMSNMFAACNKLATLDVDEFDTSNVTDMSYMFNDCNGLLTIDVSGFDTTSCTNMRGMFMNCQNLKTIDLSSFDTSKATNLSDFFYRMFRLQEVTLGESFGFTGDGSTSCVLPTPDSTYISGAIGKWQAVGEGTTTVPTGTIYLPEDVPSNVAETYVMPITTISVDVPIKVTLAASADGTWCTPTATANQIINHSLAPVNVVSAEATSVNGFTMLAANSVEDSTTSNVFGGTITAGSGSAQDLTSIDTSADVWTMAAETDADDSDLISLQLTGSIGNVEGTYFTEATQLFGIAYTFELAL